MIKHSILIKTIKPTGLMFLPIAYSIMVKDTINIINETKQRNSKIVVLQSLFRDTEEFMTSNFKYHF